jgi:hypothetical protein
VINPLASPRTVHFDEITIRFFRQRYYQNEQVYQLEVRQSPGPLPGGAFQADFDAQLDRFGQIFNQRLRESRFFYRYQTSVAEPETVNQLAELGRQLYALLPEPFRLALPRLLQHVFDRGRGVRLIIEARAGDQAERLLSLPWELLFFQETGVYPARSPRVVIVRRLLEAIRRSPIALTPPFEVVHVIAHAAAGPEKYQLDPQLRQTEQTAIQHGVAPEHYHPVTDPGSVSQMLAVVRAERGQIVHFLGHGKFFEAGIDAPAEAGRSYLRFVDEAGASEWVTGAQLQQLLSFSPGVQVVVLNACHGGAIATANVALELVYSGLPYVVAIQNDILQEAAGHFSRAFYAELQRSADVAYAVAVGRAEIAVRLPHTVDWCLPVLYTNVGLAEPSLPVKVAETGWHWASIPQSGPVIALANLALGGIQLLLGVLLWLSGAAPPLPNGTALGWLTLGLAIVPLLLVSRVYQTGQLVSPPDWPRSSRAALVLNALASAAIGLGLPTVYGGMVLILLAGLGLFDLLSIPAQGVVMVLVFAPGFLLSYSQIVGQGRAFINNGQIEDLPAFSWAELALPLAGYVQLLLPWVAIKFGAIFTAPPGGNLLTGLLLVALYFQLRKES